MVRWLGVALLLIAATPAAAQPIEISPFGGVRFGGDPFEVVATPAAVVDRRPAIGFIIDFPLQDGAQFEGLFSYQQASVLIPGGSFASPARAQVSVASGFQRERTSPWHCAVWPVRGSRSSIWVGAQAARPQARRTSAEAVRMFPPKWD
jgi:hypothetical protein